MINCYFVKILKKDLEVDSILKIKDELKKDGAHPGMFVEDEDSIYIQVNDKSKINKKYEIFIDTGFEFIYD